MEFVNLPSTFIQNLFDMLPSEDQKNCRLLCKESNKMFQCKLLKDFTLIVDGSNSDAESQSLQTFTNTATPWIHLSFLNADMNPILGKEIAFYNFTRKMRPSLKSLSIKDCSNLGLGRFMEMITFLDNVVELSIEDMPTMYDGDAMQVLNWRNFIDPFVERLKSLKKLTLIEEKSEVLNDDLAAWFLLDSTASLESLTVHTGIKPDSAFPTASICRAIINCNNSLRKLKISGNYEPVACDGTVRQTLWKAMSIRKVNMSRLEGLAVRHLSLHDMDIVLHDLKSLRSLELNDTTLPFYVFKDVHQCLPKLQHLHVEDCNIEKGVVGMKFACFQSLHSVTFLWNHKATLDDDTYSIVEEYASFFENASPTLVKIEVQGTSSRPRQSCRNLLDRIVTRRVQTLKMSYLEGFQRCEKNALLEVHDCLKSLDLSFTDVNDEWSAVLGRMDGLQTLDLQNTEVGLLTAEGIMALPNLKEVDFTNTFATDEAYQNLFAINQVQIILTPKSEDTSDSENDDLENVDDDDFEEYIAACTSEFGTL